MKPLKSQFKEYVQFSDNIPDRLIDYHIDAAYRFTIEPILRNTEATEMHLGSTIYGYTPIESPGTETKPELVAFYNNFLKEWWIRLAYQRFIEVHGLNVTQFGLTKTKDPENTFDQAEERDRAVLLRRLRDDLNIIEGNVFAELNRIEWILDLYPFKGANVRASQRKVFGISGIGGKKRRRGCSINPWTLSDDGEYSSEDYNSDYNI
jgi:hypothetical protein